MPAFALANWHWLLPVLLIAGLGAYGGWQHMEVLSLKASIATEQAAAEKAVNDAKAADAIKTAKLQADHTTAVKALQEKANAQQIAIAGAPRSVSCLDTGAARAFISGLHSPDKAGAGAARPAAKPDAAVPR
jgi:hypothetical protein